MMYCCDILPQGQPWGEKTLGYMRDLRLSLALTKLSKNRKMRHPGVP